MNYVERTLDEAMSDWSIAFRVIEKSAPVLNSYTMEKNKFLGITLKRVSAIF